MLKYLIIPLTDNAVSFCHYEVKRKFGNIIPVKLLEDSIRWSMKENLMIQFIYPKEDLPRNILKLIDTVDHADIVPYDIESENIRNSADIVVFDNIAIFDRYEFKDKLTYVVRAPLAELQTNKDILKYVLGRALRINIVVTDTNDITDDYDDFLHSLIPTIVNEYKRGHHVQLNLLTDRLTLTEMNNCNAGCESITLAPDGRFYICPAFYRYAADSVGDLKQGLNIRNNELFNLTHAPICRNCDAWQCKRCVWLNKTSTREVNTPGRQQCIMAHMERNASRDLLSQLRDIDSSFMVGTEITEIDYLDPFELIVK